MKRREFIALLGGAAAAWPLVARAQQSEKAARLGFLGSTSPTAQVYVERVQAFRTGLRDLGYIEGKNLVLEFRWANGDYARLPELAAELLRLDIDVTTGIVSGLSRPGGNITGSTFLNPELVAKRFDLAKEALPSIARVAFLFNPDNALDGEGLLQSAVKTAQTLNVELETVAARTPEEISAALSAMKARHIDAVTATDDAMFFSHAGAIAEASVQNRLILFGNIELAQAGGLIGYGPDITELYRRAAIFVDKIIKGAKPADIPVEQPTRFKLAINLKTAKMLGLQVPNHLLAVADEVIE